jgi:hypothetical protein
MEAAHHTVQGEAERKEAGKNAISDLKLQISEMNTGSMANTRCGLAMGISVRAAKGPAPTKRGRVTSAKCKHWVQSVRANILRFAQDENYESATPAYSDTLWVGKP